MLLCKCKYVSLPETFFDHWCLNSFAGKGFTQPYPSLASMQLHYLFQGFETCSKQQVFYSIAVAVLMITTSISAWFTEEKQLKTPIIIVSVLAYI
jgi:hypothetical protein